MEIKKIKSFNGRYKFLSNFFEYPMICGQNTWKTAEHWYQAIKVEEEKDFVQIRDCDSPKTAKELGNTCKRWGYWHVIKLHYMEMILKRKFSIPKLADKLLSTKEIYLENCNNDNDVFWGTVNGIGENHLGKILMKIREEIEKEKI